MVEARAMLSNQTHRHTISRWLACVRFLLHNWLCSTSNCHKMNEVVEVGERGHWPPTNSQTGWYGRLARSQVSQLGQIQKHKQYSRHLSHLVVGVTVCQHLLLKNHGYGDEIQQISLRKDESRRSAAARRRLEDVRSVNTQETMRKETG